MVVRPVFGGLCARVVVAVVFGGLCARVVVAVVFGGLCARVVVAVVFGGPRAPVVVAATCGCAPLAGPGTRFGRVALVGRGTPPLGGASAPDGGGFVRVSVELRA
ncbi:hypothetical protein GCM10022284_48240 [Streptomyces hundungensis]